MEFTVLNDDSGRIKAERVTGPLGAFVKGASRQRFEQRSFSSPDDFDFGGFSFDSKPEDSTVSDSSDQLDPPKPNI